jgi:hypothetical protein
VLVRVAGTAGRDDDLAARGVCFCVGVVKGPVRKQGEKGMIKDEAMFEVRSVPCMGDSFVTIFE